MGNKASNVVDSVFPGIGSGSSAAVDSVVPDMPALPTPPAAPVTDSASIVAREAAIEEARRRSMFGRASTNPTGGLGDASTANVASKYLLGV